MVLPVVLSLVGLVAVLIALYRDEPVDAPGPALPDWDPLPSPSDVARTEFPLAFPGYDPATVEAAIDALAQAYGDVLAVAPPDVVERARHRAERRTGRPSQATWTPADRPADGGRPTRRRSASHVSSRASAPEARTDAEALRAEAALSALDPADPEQTTA